MSGVRFGMGIIINNLVVDKLQEFLTKAQSIKKMQNEEAYSHCIKAEALRLKNYFFESIEEYLISLSFDATNIDALKGLGHSYKQVGYLKSAIQSFNNVKKLSPFDKTIYYELGCCYAMNNEFTNAIKHYKKAVKIDPNYIDAYFNMAIAFEFSNDINTALKIYAQIIGMKPSYIAAYNNLAGLYMRTGMYYAAIQNFRKILAMNPDFSRAYLGIAVALDKMDKKGDALRYYRKYTEIKPNSANNPYILERINMIRSEKRTSNSVCHLKLIKTGFEEN